MTQNDQSILQPEELKPVTELINKTLEQLNRILLGRNELHKMVLIGILSRGHILLEGLPGLGKTALVRTLGAILQLDFKRIQFTPDLMPSDILGMHILQETSTGSREMIFKEGPVFTNILLSDEINRASPKTQSAMLETMQEHTVTLLGKTRKLPSPFFVLASQNPIELEGTYPLPEAQLDRFLFKLIVKNIDVETIEKIISGRRRGQLPEPTWTMSKDELQHVFSVMEKVFLPLPVSRYISRLVSATHPDFSEATENVRQYILYGASPRAAISIAESARGHALINERPTVGFEDVKAVAFSVLNHRIILNYKARFDKVNAMDIIDDLLSSIDEAGITLPEDIEVKK
ncbi:MAG: AAA family ATPase [Candidatus Aureabacteria bacterium]|nr:AAA family ATPase [Candidatus Auribacterota bacterium]